MKMFQKSLTLTIDKSDTLVPLLSGFNKVNLLDTTHISLPQEAAELFAGAGGSSSEAGAKIQLVIDYHTGNFSHLDLSEATLPDQKLISRLSALIEAEDLWIFDLGCVSQDNLLILANHGA
jgi:hypothetical protein